MWKSPVALKSAGSSPPSEITALAPRILARENGPASSSSPLISMAVSLVLMAKFKLSVEIASVGRLTVKLLTVSSPASPFPVATRVPYASF